MVFLLLRLFLPLPLIFGLLVGFVQVGAADNPLDGGFDERCATPCFLGIHPGATAIEAARAALETHPWVTAIDDRMEMDYFGYEHLHFRWRLPGSAADWPGELISSYGTVYSVHLESDLRLFDVWAVFDAPPLVGVSAAQIRSGQVRVYNTFLADSSLGAMVILECPLSMRAVLEGQVSILELRRRDAFTPLPQIARNPGRMLRALRNPARPIC